VANGSKAQVGLEDGESKRGFELGSSSRSRLIDGQLAEAEKLSRGARQAREEGRGRKERGLGENSKCFFFLLAIRDYFTGQGKSWEGVQAWFSFPVLFIAL